MTFCLTSIVAGRNIHALDPYRMPSQVAMSRGRAAANLTLSQYMRDNNELPETVSAVNLPISLHTHHIGNLVFPYSGRCVERTETSSWSCHSFTYHFHFKVLSRSGFKLQQIDDGMCLHVCVRVCVTGCSEPLGA